MRTVAYTNLCIICLFANRDVSRVMDMSCIFFSVGCPTCHCNELGFDEAPSLQGFAEDISGWSMDQVTNTSGMFAGAVLFNLPLNSWELGRVTDMAFMFERARVFNQALDAWSVGRVTNMEGMFAGALSFNQPLGTWDVGQVTSTAAMFQTCFAFNQPLNTWNVQRVMSAAGMFSGTISFGMNICSWGPALAAAGANVDDMFRDARSCPAVTCYFNCDDSRFTPDLTRDPPGSFCQNCF